MSKEFNNIDFRSQSVASCYFNPFLSVILVGAVAFIDNQKKLFIKEKISFNNTLPDKVCAKLQEYSECKIWTNEDIALKSTLSRHPQTVPFNLENETQIEALGQMIVVLNMEGRISASESIEFDDSGSEKNAFKILLAALMTHLFDKQPLSRYVTGKKLDNPFKTKDSKYFY